MGSLETRPSGDSSASSTFSKAKLMQSGVPSEFDITGYVRSRSIVPTWSPTAAAVYT